MNSHHYMSPSLKIIRFLRLRLLLSPRYPGGADAAPLTRWLLAAAAPSRSCCAGRGLLCGFQPSQTPPNADASGRRRSRGLDGGRHSRGGCWRSQPGPARPGPAPRGAGAGGPRGAGAGRPRGAPGSRSRSRGAPPRRAAAGARPGREGWCCRGPYPQGCLLRVPGARIWHVFNLNLSRMKTAAQ